VGCGRSGTTLLRLIINRHPDLAIFGESAAFFRDRKYGYLSNPRALQRFIKDWSSAAAQHSPYPQLMESERLRSALARAETYVGATTLIMQEFARAEQKSVWGEKTPAHVTRLEKIFAAYPKARVIHITRDPRAVVSSATIHLGNGRFEPAGAYAIARYWVRCEAEIQKFVARFPDKIAMIRYEDLVTQTEAVVRRLCEFLGVIYDNGMLDIAASAQRYAPKTEAGGEILRNHLGLTKNINAGALDNWRETLRPELTALVENATAPWFDRRGYTAAAKMVALSRTGISFVVRARWIAQEAWRFLYRFSLLSFWHIRANFSG